MKTHAHQIIIIQTIRTWIHSISTKLIIEDEFHIDDNTTEAPKSQIKDISSSHMKASKFGKSCVRDRIKFTMMLIVINLIENVILNLTYRIKESFDNGT